MTSSRIAKLPDTTPTKQIFDEGVVPRHLHKWELDGPEYEGMDHARCVFSWLISPGPRGKKPRVRVCNEYKDIGQIEEALDEREALMVIGGPLSKEKWSWALRNCGSAAKALLGFAVLALYAITADAQFTGGDQILLPIVANASPYATSINLTNLSDDPVTVSGLFVPANTSTANMNLRLRHYLPTWLEPHERRPVEASEFGITGAGMLVLNACKADEVCVPVLDAATGTYREDETNYRAISAEVRVYSHSAPGSRGDGYLALPWYETRAFRPAQSAQTITGIQWNVQRHTNVTIANASEFNATKITCTLFNGHGQQIGQPYTQALGPMENVSRSVESMWPEVNNSNRLNRGPEQIALWIRVEQSGTVPTAGAQKYWCAADGCPAFVAYASVTDNLSGDFSILIAGSEGDGSGQVDWGQNLQRAQAKDHGDLVHVSNLSGHVAALARAVDPPLCSFGPPRADGDRLLLKNGKPWTYVHESELHRVLAMCGGMVGQ